MCDLMFRSLLRHTFLQINGNNVFRLHRQTTLHVYIYHIYSFNLTTNLSTESDGYGA